MRKALAAVAIIFVIISVCGGVRDRRTGKSSSTSNRGSATGDVIIFAVAPTADFTISGSVNGRAPQTITFTDASAGGATSWSWDFGDGQSSTDQSPTHTFTTGTAADVSLTATNDAGSDTKTTAGAVDLLDPYWYPSSFSIDMLSGKLTIKSLVFSPTGGGTVYCRIYDDDTQAQVGIDKSSSATPPTFSGTTVINGIFVRAEYWVTAAPAGYATWGSSSDRLVLLSRTEIVNGTGTQSGIVPAAHP